MASHFAVGINDNFPADQFGIRGRPLLDKKADRVKNNSGSGNEIFANLFKRNYAKQPACSNQNI
jgi:hypothetical protein